MSKQSRIVLKSYFERGDRPTQEQFEDLIDSNLILNEDATQEISGSIIVGNFISASHSVVGNINTRYNEFLADIDNLNPTEVVFLDTDCDAGVTLSSSAVHTCAWDASATSEVTLPLSFEGNYIIWRQSALADEANAITFSTSGSDTFEGNQIVRISTTTSSVDISEASDNHIIITPSASNSGWGGIGSQISFYCRTGSKWLVRTNEVPIGTGTNGSIQFSGSVAI
jgi:hypothetical protein